MCRLVHRDLHTKNILVDPGLTHATLIDMDLMCIVGGVVGLDRDKELQQVWPLQFSSWEGKLCSTMDSQQLATVLVQLYTWDLLRPADLMSNSVLFVFDVNFCTGCGLDSLKPWCDACDPFIKYFRSLYTWPLHLQRPHCRSHLLRERMMLYLNVHKAPARVKSVFTTACNTASIVPAFWENIFTRM